MMERDKNSFIQPLLSCEWGNMFERNYNKQIFLQSELKMF